MINVAAYLAGIPERVGSVSDRMAAGEDVSPDEVGAAALEVGTLPLMGAIGGIPRNAVGQVGAPYEYPSFGSMAVAGGAAGFGGTPAYDLLTTGEWKGWQDEETRQRMLENGFIGAVAAPTMMFGARLADDFLSEPRVVTSTRNVPQSAQRIEPQLKFPDSNLPSKSGPPGARGKWGAAGSDDPRQWVDSMSAHSPLNDIDVIDPYALERLRTQQSISESIDRGKSFG